jgi:spermidine/putrescine-binding protein
MARSKTGLSFRLSSAIGTCGILIVPMFLSTSCSIGKITFANFESYMDSDLIKRYSSQASFVYYSTNEDIELKFKKSYDIAVPTCYEVLNLLRKDELERIDWPKFNLNYNQGEEIIQNGDEVEENLLTLPTEIGAGTGSNCTEIVQAVSAYALRKNIFPE